MNAHRTLWWKTRLGGRGQVVTATISALAFVVGLCVFLITWRVYLSAQEWTYRAYPEGEGDFVLVTEKLSTEGAGSGFTRESLASLGKLPGVRAAYPVESNQFKTQIFMNFGGKQYGTEAFCEAVEDAALSPLPAGWTWHEGVAVPLMIPRDFLNLYNLGFAKPRGLPALTSDVLAGLPLGIEIEGRGMRRQFLAKIVALSDRVPSVLVPMDFMKFANAALGSGTSIAPSRVLVNMEDPSSPVFQTFLNEFGLEAQDKSSGLRNAMYTASLVCAGLALFGLFVLGLGFALLVLHARRDLERSKIDLEVLLEFGHKPLTLSLLRSTRTALVFCALVVVANIVASTLYSRIITLVHGYFLDWNECSDALPVVVSIAAFLTAAIVPGFLLARTWEGRSRKAGR